MTVMYIFFPIFYLLVIFRTSLKTTICDESILSKYYYYLLLLLLFIVK